MVSKEEYINELIGRFPNSIGIELTTYCQLNCIYCQHEKVERKNQHMTIEQFSALSEKIKDFNNVVLCGIGEPMLYPYIYDVVPAIKQDVLIITNGSIEIDFKRLNQNRNVKVIVFSVDEPDEEGMKQITENYKWDVMLENLNNSLNSGILIRMINCTINSKNYDKVEQLIEFANKHRMTAINFTFDIYDLQIKENAISELNKYIEDEKKINKTKLLITNSTNSLKCITWNEILPFVAINGDVYPCCIGMKEEMVMGNVYDSDFEEIFHGEKYQQFQTGNFCSKCKLLREYNIN